MILGLEIVCTHKKLDGVGPIDNRPSTRHLEHFVKKKKHISPDTGHVTHGGGRTFLKNLSSQAFMVWDRQCLEESEQKDDLMTYSININYRTAPATPGVLNIDTFHQFF